MLVALGCASTQAASAANPSSSAAPPPENEAPAAPEQALGLVRGKGDEADRWLESGERHYFQDRLADATTAFERARTQLPDHPAPLVGLTLVALKRSQYRIEYACCGDDARLLRLRHALDASVAPDFMPRFLVLAQLDLMLGNAVSARDLLTRALALAPDDARVVASLGIAELATGNVRAALTHLERATELDPDAASSWTNLGVAWMMNEAPERAKDAYARAVELDPKSARAQSDLGTALIALGQARLAIVHLEEALRLAPERATVLNNLGYAHAFLDDADRAEALYRRAITSDPRLVSAWVNLGVLKARQKQFGAAREALLEAQRLDPEDPRVIENLRELDQQSAEPSAE